jgi:hypothetical protein
MSPMSLFLNSAPSQTITLDVFPQFDLKVIKVQFDLAWWNEGKVLRVNGFVNF